MAKIMDGKKAHRAESFTTTVDLIKNYAIYTLDKEGVITSWNEGAVDLIGWVAKEVIGKHFSFLYSPEATADPTNDLEVVLKNGSCETESVWLKKNGKEFLTDITITQIHDSRTGHHNGYIVVAKDITEKRRQETDQIDANSLLKSENERRKVIEKALKESNAELEAFAAAASHDLQEPLRMVISYLQLIDRRYKDKFDKDGKEFLEFAVDGAMRMRALISDLVEYARIDTLAKPFRKVDTNQLIAQVLNNLQLSADDAGIKVTYDKFPTIWGEPVQLAQLFQNLIANAIKFCDKPAPHVHIGYQEKGDEYIFRVEDNGRGIKKSEFSKIFLIFKQLGPRTERRGSGVGLSIAKKIVTRHHGRIWVESVEGKGSTFYFTLPKQIKAKEKVHARHAH